jgi:hypothetical protein
MVNKHRLIISFLIFCYVLALILIYYFVIVRYYAYEGYSWRVEPNRIFFSSLMMAYVLLNISTSRYYSDFIFAVCCVLTILSLVPNLVLYCFSGTDPRIAFLYFFYFLLLYFLGDRLNLSIKGTTLINNMGKLKLLLLVSVFAVIPFLVVYLPHINLNNLLLKDITESRQLQKNLSSPYFGYTYFVLSKLVIPVTLVYSMWERKSVTSMLLIGLLIFLFLCGGHKAVFFGIIVTYLFYFGDYYAKVKRVLLGILGLYLASFFVLILSGNYLLFALFSNRALLLPALINDFYFSFFDETPLYYSHTLLKNFLTYPFSKDPSFLIGEMFFHSTEVQANDGIVSDGYMNFGLVGSMINIFFMTFIMTFIKSANIDFRFFGVFIVFFLTSEASPFTTLMLTHGGLVLIFIVQMYLKNSRLE